MEKFFFCASFTIMAACAVFLTCNEVGNRRLERQASVDAMLAVENSADVFADYYSGKMEEAPDA